MLQYMQTNYLILLAFLYAGGLFLAAARAERVKRPPRWMGRAVYSLSLAVYCTSWTFFGAVGVAANNGWGYFAIYLGPILLFLLGWPFLRRLLIFSNRNKVTSIADFVGSRSLASAKCACTCLATSFIRVSSSPCARYLMT